MLSCPLYLIDVVQADGEEVAVEGGGNAAEVHVLPVVDAVTAGGVAGEEENDLGELVT